jgi:signal transduction histidine kinase/ActR/RegA family two-component response regulator
MDYMPHGQCILWRAEVLGLMVFSDVLIVLAYLTIPVTLVRFVRRRRDLEFNWIFYLFASFIVLCGLTHAMSILTIWKPIYRAEAALKLLTGLVSIATAWLLIRLVPTLMRYPSPHDLQEANARLAVANDALEHAVAERTEELSRARDAALEANKAKSLFLATMSHEIRTPLNGLIGTMGLLEDTKPTPVQKDLMEIMRLSGDALLTVINDVLDFSKIEAGKLSLERAPFDLRKTVREAFGLLSVQARRKGLDLQLEVDADVPTVCVGDAGRLRQILLNLLSNAVKFTGSGFVRCEVKALEVEEKRARLRFVVEDTGIGIPAEAQAELFRPFMQADASTTRRFGGTGLGLAICARLVQLMQGTIQVESAVGRGSRFRFELEFALDRSASAMTDPSAALAGKKVLIVDDVEVNRRILRHQLEGAGCECIEAHSAAEALELLMADLGNAEPLDAAIIDVEMPVMNGMMLVRAIRAQTNFSRFPIILTSSAELRDAGHRFEDMVHATLMKPAAPGDLLRALSGALWRADWRGFAEEEMSEAEAVVRERRVLVAEDNAVNQR